jgi:hypothetical protein
MLQSISQKIPDDRLRMQLVSCWTACSTALQKRGGRFWDMRETDSRDWVTQLRHSVETYSPAAGPRVLIDVSHEPLPALGGRQYDLLRIGQEAVLNTVKHSSASEIRITVSFSLSCLRLALYDDGQGFNPEWQHGPNSHWGLIGMRHRAEKIGARLTVRSSREHGTTIEATVPLSPPGGEDSTSFASGVPASRLRLEAMEPEWLYSTLGLFSGYRVSYVPSFSAVVPTR